jgi:hypothetical protein
MTTPHLRTPSERFVVMRRPLLLFVLSDGLCEKERIEDEKHICFYDYWHLNTNLEDIFTNQL